MKRMRLVQTGGVCAISSGLWALTFQLESDTVIPWPLPILILIVLWLGTLAGLLGLGKSGRLGKVSLWVGITGIVLVLVLFSAAEILGEQRFAQFDLPWGVFLALLLTIPFGLVLYGIAALREKPLLFGNGLPLFAGGFVVAMFFSDSLRIPMLERASVLLISLSWVALGYIIIVTGSRIAASSVPSTADGMMPSGVGKRRIDLRVGLVALIAFLSVEAFVLQANAQHTTCPTEIGIPASNLAGAPRPPVIVDNDMAHEDMHAILYLLEHPEVEVKAITIAGTGEAHCGAGVRNALNLVAQAGNGNIPVACGPEQPLKGQHAFPDAWRAEADDLYGIRLPASAGVASEMSAPDLIASVAKESSQKVILIAVGPLTNVARALIDHPDLTNHLEMIYIMGGAVEIFGNVGFSGVDIENLVAEWNIYIDPHAANVVFASGVPVTLVPLNATHHAPVTTDFFACLQENHQTPAASLVYQILRANYDFVESGGFQFWDSLTAAIATDESLASFQMSDLIVVEEEGPESGQTRPDKDGHPIRVATAADGDRFEAMLLAVLNGHLSK